MVGITFHMNHLSQDVTVNKYIVYFWTMLDKENLNYHQNGYNGYTNWLSPFLTEFGPFRILKPLHQSKYL